MSTTGHRFEPRGLVRSLASSPVVVVTYRSQILAAMKAEGVSRSELAVRVDRTRSWVSQILSEDRNVTLLTLHMIAGALGYRLEVRIKKGKR